MLEKDLEDILSKHPDLIEPGLRLDGRQVTIYGRRMDLLFQDRFGRKLIVELKSGPIKDQHIGQILSYEGMLLSADDPTIRVMLIGNRVPPNIQRALDHHGIAWKEMPLKALQDFLKQCGDSTFDKFFEEDAVLQVKPPAGQAVTPPVTVIVPLPNRSAEATPKKTTRQPKTTRSIPYQAFWQGFAAHPALRSFPYHFSVPREEHWCNVGKVFPKSSALIAFTILPSQSEIRCHLYIPKEVALYNHLLRQKPQIDQALGQGVTWRSPGTGVKCGNIYVSRPCDLGDHGNWPTAYDWFVIKLPLFARVFKPLLSPYML